MVISQVNDTFKAFSELKVFLIMKWLDFVRNQSPLNNINTYLAQGPIIVFTNSSRVINLGNMNFLGGGWLLLPGSSQNVPCNRWLLVWTHYTVMTTVGRKRQIHGDSEKVSVWREGGRGRKEEKAKLEES